MYETPEGRVDLTLYCHVSPLYLGPHSYSLLPSIASLGYVENVVIDGTTCSGNVPNAKPTDSPIRHVLDISPVKDPSNPSRPQRPADYYERTCQPWLGHGVLLVRSLVGKMYVFFPVSPPNSPLCRTRLFFLP